VQELSEADRHSFITPDLWSPNIRDINFVNYVWGIIQQASYQTEVQGRVNDLRQRLIEVWAGVEQSVIDDTILHDLRRSLIHAGIRVRRGHFEYSRRHKLVKTLFTVINVMHERRILKCAA